MYVFVLMSPNLGLECNIPWLLVFTIIVQSMLHPFCMVAILDTTSHMFHAGDMNRC